MASNSGRTSFTAGLSLSAPDAVVDTGRNAVIRQNAQDESDESGVRLALADRPGDLEVSAGDSAAVGAASLFRDGRCWRDFQFGFSLGCGMSIDDASTAGRSIGDHLHEAGW
jgi:hypothetical protein